MEFEFKRKLYTIMSKVPGSEVWGFRVMDTANRRISNFECRKVESLRSNLLKRKGSSVDTILRTNH